MQLMYYQPPIGCERLDVEFVAASYSHCAVNFVQLRSSGAQHGSHSSVQCLLSALSCLTPTSYPSYRNTLDKALVLDDLVASCTYQPCKLAVAAHSTRQT